jgi:hypothetical protein
VSSGDRFWTRRLRWRLRGATQWPAFAILTVVEAVVIDQLPPISPADGMGLNLFEGLLIATFANLFLVGAAAPWLARRLAARRAAALTAAGAPAPTEVERDVLRDRTATALLVAGLAAVVAAGLANRPVIVSETEATEAAGRAVLEYVERSGSEELRRNAETANIVKLGDDYFRVCIARDERDRFFCLFVDTADDPPEVVRDPSVEPNISR